MPQLPLSQAHWAHRCYWNHWHRWVSRWGHQRESHCYLFRRQYQRVQERSLPAQVAQQEKFQQRMILLVTLVTQTQQRDLILNLQYQNQRHFRFPRRQSQEMLLQDHLQGFRHFQGSHQNQERVPNQLASRYFHYFLDLDQILSRSQMAQGHRVFPRHQGQKDLDSRRHQHLGRSLAAQDSCFQVQKILLAVLEVFQGLDVH